jgi:hypothetical protein
MEFPSSIKMKENISFAAKWMVLKGIMLNDLRQTQKVNHHVFSVMCGSFKKG